MRIHEFRITPALPENLAPLREIAYNLRWTWDHDSIELFRRVSKRLWERVAHNPVRLLGEVDQDRLAALAKDRGFLAHMDRVAGQLRHHLERETWADESCRLDREIRIAYFSAEFGLTESLPIYSGGLGILAGDHLKSCSELGVPLIGVGLLYQKGYFQQYLTNDGWQHEEYPINDFHTMPLQLERGADGSPLRIAVELLERRVAAQIWRVKIGRIPLFLLDTNIPENSAADQDISDELYGGDQEMRICQEILLGVGGLRALRALDLTPTVCHMNEGHSAFLALERIRGLMERFQLDPQAARLAAEAGNLFTTHTPVPAGIDQFPVELVARYLKPYVTPLKLDPQRVLALGTDPRSGNFSMAVLAIRLSNRINAVSRLHGRVSRKMFAYLWPGAPEEEAPIGHVTNGVHARSWISFEMATLYDRYLGPRWTEEPSDQTVWESVAEIPDSELWATHERRRERLVAFVRRTLHTQLERRGAPDRQVALAGEVLDPGALTIGFARRFAPYKRSTLLFQDFARLARILTDATRPVQILFAGKAHPQDSLGKELIRQIIRHLQDERIRQHVVFLENYDLSVARYLVQGVDVWLNTPRRLREASGTSGMKATANGALNLSILDGWWDEAYGRELGWAIGRGEEYDDETYQDMVESRALYDLLENDVVPLFYTRGSDGIPRGWTAKMKAAMRELCPRFNTNRMVCTYVTDYYLRCAERYGHLTADQGARARALAEWIRRIEAGWEAVRLEEVTAEGLEAAQVGGAVTVHCRVHLGALAPEDVVVQAFHGRLDERGHITAPQLATLQPQVDASGAPRPASGEHVYAGEIPCRHSGREGFAVRVLPAHEDLLHPHAARLIRWAE